MYESSYQARCDVIPQQIAPIPPDPIGDNALTWNSPVLQDVSKSPPSCTAADTRILVIDDDEWIRDILSRVLTRSSYQVKTAESAEDALELLCAQPYDIIVSDMNMKGMTGLDLTNIVSHLYPHIPIILITADRDTELMRAALRQGAADFISKPFDSESIPIIIERNLERRALNRKQVEEFRQSHLFANVQMLASAIDAKEPFTAQHSRRVARLSRAIADAMQLPETERQFVDWAAQVHDVGKIATPDYVLLKPGQLTDVEWEIMRQHPLQGAQIVAKVPDLRYVAGIVRSHHERIDGRGYPDGLHGDEIPLLARIIAVSDAFEVMTSDRVYRTRLPEEEALHRLVTGSNTQFDACVVDIFRSLPSEVRC